ncbi:hypothetical protein M407DRAFT_75768 [Tulasnella calospora MUT 4182]|uniref:DUF6589 domain-containing protein n=1 Tax=Tulasnella calospora MUT 4182 TaxID=1051891 RepID=A0A0C3QHX3_9AGAM|nr:hypothetical protein M407DRAFT_75768 [Tulasnella calospora MUT 4182]
MSFIAEELGEEDEELDPSYALPRTDEDRVVTILEQLHSEGIRFSLNRFLTTLFRSDDPRITQYTNTFLGRDGAVDCAFIPSLEKFKSAIPPLKDEHGLEPHITRQFYLPTLDQEQGTVKGNMEVLEEYLFRILNIPHKSFEKRLVAVLGDRLTTARDRSAQAYRSLDRSESRGERFASLVLLPGLMHTRLAFIELLNRQLWHTGKASERDPTDLGVLHQLLDHRTRVKHGKIEFYAWLRFLEAIFSGMAISAVGALLPNCTSVEDLSNTLGARIKTREDLEKLAMDAVDRYLMPSVDRLEATDVKTVEGDSVVGHAVITFQLLALLQNLTHSIKYGHITRILDSLKFMYPIFYAGGSYNYSAEIGEFLHNVTHDWPKQSVDTLVGALLVNTTGRPDGFKETDLNGEHYNKDIKDLAHGPNMTPKILSQLTPSLGVLSEVCDILVKDLGVENRHTRHSHVKAAQDVEILAEHFIKNSVFDFSRDRASGFKVPDFYSKGRSSLAGVQGGHRRQLQRYELGLRNRADSVAEEVEDMTMNDRELYLEDTVSFELGDEYDGEDPDELLQQSDDDD